MREGTEIQRDALIHEYYYKFLATKSMRANSVFDSSDVQAFRAESNSAIALTLNA